MGADTSSVEAVVAPPLSPLSLTPRLAGAPVGAPRFRVTIRSRAGGEVLLADPRATRALVALMNVHTINDKIGRAHV